MDAREIAGRAGALGRTRVLLHAVALAAGYGWVAGCMGGPEHGPGDAALPDAATPDAAPSSPDAAPEPPRFVQTAYLRASNPGSGDRFGASVAVAGDLIVAGAPDEDSTATGIDGDQDDDSAWDNGAVYAFRRGDAGWHQEAYIKPTFSLYEPGSPWLAEAEFGRTVALSGDTLAVSAVGDGTGGSLSGAVYVFRRTATGWQHEAFLNDPGAYLFGFAMALDGDTLAVSALCELEVADPSILLGAAPPLAAGEPECPLIYVFRRSGTTWSEEARIPYPNLGRPLGWYHDHFGEDLALSGDTIAVTAPLDSSGATGIDGDPYDDSATSSGAVHVFRRSDTGWHREAYVKASNTEAFDHFGDTLALSGDTLVVGATGEDSEATGIDGDQHDNDGSNIGAVYAFRRSGAVWQQEAYLKSSHSSDNDRFGLAVALEGDTLAVASKALGVDHRGQGAMFLFHRSDAGWQAEPHPTIASERHPGSSYDGLALAGDTLVVGASFDSGRSGAFYVFQRVRE